MNLRPFALLVTLVGLASGAHADPQRIAYGFENRFPALDRMEIGMDIEYREARIFEKNDGFSAYKYQLRQDYTRTSYGPFIRSELFGEVLYGILKVPVVSSEPADGSSEFGLGDIQAGLQLRAYEDILGYPYVTPHIIFQLPSGDEESGAGNGESVTTLGVSVGTQIWDWLNWVATAQYQLHSELDDNWNLALSLIADISKRFSIVAELRASNRAASYEDDGVTEAGGGFSFDWTRRFNTSFMVTAPIESDVDDTRTYIRGTYLW